MQGVCDRKRGDQGGMEGWGGLPVLATDAGEEATGRGEAGRGGQRRGEAFYVEDVLYYRVFGECRLCVRVGNRGRRVRSRGSDRLWPL
eukprot:759946-Hanusia_phi.AAC.2